VRQTEQKRVKTFRTLIRRTNYGNRKAPDEDKTVNIVDNAVKERKKQFPSFFGR